MARTDPWALQARAVIDDAFHQLDEAARAAPLVSDGGRGSDEDRLALATVDSRGVLESITFDRQIGEYNPQEIADAAMAAVEAARQAAVPPRPMTPVDLSRSEVSASLRELFERRTS